MKAIKRFYFDSLPPVVKNSEGHGWINVEPAVISGQQAPENETLHFYIFNSEVTNVRSERVIDGSLRKNINSCSDIKAATYGLSLYSDLASFCVQGSAQLY